MNIDFSLFKNIDFTNRDNLLFAGIAFITVMTVLIVFIVILKKILEFINKLLREIFSPRVRKSKEIKAEVEGLVESQSQQGVQGASILPTTKATSGNQLSGISAPMQKANEISNFKFGDKKIEGKNETQQSYKEKEAKDILESLGKLQAGQEGEKDTMESKMPARDSKIEDLGSAPIKINRPKDFSANNVQAEKASIFSKKPEVQKSSKNDDGTIFKGEAEVSRRKLEHEVRTSSKVWQASKAVELTLSPIERSKLIKEVFSPEYGVNISKKDLQTGLRKLNRKMLDTSDIKQHEKIRKEIKFFKKIGGVR